MEKPGNRHFSRAPQKLNFIEHGSTETISVSISFNFWGFQVLLRAHTFLKYESHVGGKNPLWTSFCAVHERKSSRGNIKLPNILICHKNRLIIFPRRSSHQDDAQDSTTHSPSLGVGQDEGVYLRYRRSNTFPGITGTQRQGQGKLPGLVWQWR